MTFAPPLLERVAASAAGAGVTGLDAEVEVLRARARSTVLEYRFEGGVRLIAKRYARRADAQAAYDVLRVLREQGFGPDSRYRVSEPVACRPDLGVLLVRPAAGERLPMLAERSEAWENGLLAAAGWLARLHSTRVGGHTRPRDLTQGVFRLARRAARAAAQHPELSSLLVELIETLAARAEDLGASRSHVAAHSRYHPGHVFVAPDAATVIDLDRIALGDPALDVGEFLHCLCAEARRARLGDEHADRASLAFLEEYAGHARGIPDGLAYYWSYGVLSKLLRVVELDQERWEKRLAFYRAEFDRVPSRARTLSELVEEGM
jgi:Phosphotransferase enzyme family